MNTAFKTKRPKAGNTGDTASQGGIRPLATSAKEDPQQPSGKSYTSFEVAQIAGVSLRQLQWWDERKVVSPQHEGHRRVYLPGEVVEITVIAELRRKGFSLQKIRRVLRFLHKEMGRRLSEVLEARAELHLVTDGKNIFLEDQHSRIIDLLKNADQPMFLVCVTDQVRRLEEPLSRKPAGAASATSAGSRRGLRATG